MPTLLRHAPGLLVLVMTAQAPTNAADGGVAMTATLETSNGKPVRLSALWSKPTVLFYEDRDSTALNQHVKDALSERGRREGLQDKVAVVAVANVAPWNWFPARNFVLTAVRDIEKQVNVPVYLDFTGELSGSPWNLPPRTSTVMVMDEQGRPVWRAQGRLSPAKLEELFKALDQLIVH
ncbi:MAG: hypothetical protein IAE78_25875 [Myxococcus sp.]|nr:hypothetical protein [Myxococcus sp.]